MAQINMILHIFEYNPFARTATTSELAKQVGNPYGRIEILVSDLSTLARAETASRLSS